MKKLKKLNLNNASLMNEAEMKMITGGYSSGGYNFCDGKTTCKSNKDCSGSQKCTSSGGKKCCF